MSNFEANALMKVVGFLRVLWFPPTGNFDGVSKVKFFLEAGTVLATFCLVFVFVFRRLSV